MSTIFLTSVAILALGFALGWFIGSDRWPSVERQLKGYVSRTDTWFDSTHRAFLSMGGLFVLGAALAWALGDDTARAIFSRTLTGMVFLGSVFMAIGIAAWVIQTRRPQQ